MMISRDILLDKEFEMYVLIEGGIGKLELKDN